MTRAHPRRWQLRDSACGSGLAGMSLIAERCSLSRKQRRAAEATQRARGQDRRPQYLVCHQSRQGSRRRWRPSCVRFTRLWVPPNIDLPHLHRDWAHPPAHVCAGTALAAATSALGLGSPRPHLRRDTTTCVPQDSREERPARAAEGYRRVRVRRLPRRVLLRERAQRKDHARNPCAARAARADHPRGETRCSAYRRAQSVAIGKSASSVTLGLIIGPLSVLLV